MNKVFVHSIISFETGKVSTQLANLQEGPTFELPSRLILQNLIPNAASSLFLFSTATEAGGLFNSTDVPNGTVTEFMRHKSSI